jgi:hypothetical protein
MTRPKLAGLAVLLAACMGLSAAAQVPITPAQPDPDDPDAVLVEELVVTAALPGPAFWRVEDADTTVYVLGVPGTMPKGLAWDRSLLERRLKGANRVILPFNTVSVNLLGVPGAAINIMRLRSSTPYEDSLPADVKARFVAARTRIGKAPKDYKTKNGLAAGIILVGHYWDYAKLTAADPAKTIGRLAKARKIKVEQKAYPLGPLSGAILRAPAAAQRACLDDALDEVESGAAQAQRAAAGWAEGDVRAALSAQRGFEKCLVAAPGALAFDSQVKADQAAAIARALKQPGHAIAVVQLRPLLSQGGVLDRLRAQGYTVKTPGEE